MDRAEVEELFSRHAEKNIHLIGLRAELTELNYQLANWQTAERIEELEAMAEGLEADINEAENIWTDEVEAIKELILELPNEKQKTILGMRYLAHMKYSDIAEALGYSEPNVYVLHRNGLEAIKEKFV